MKDEITFLMERVVMKTRFILFKMFALSVLLLTLGACAYVADTSGYETYEAYMPSEEQPVEQLLPAVLEEEPEEAILEEEYEEEPAAEHNVVFPYNASPTEDNQQFAIMPTQTIDAVYAESWFRENLSNQAHGGMFIRAHGAAYPQTHRLHIWVVDEEYVGAALVQFPGTQVEFVLERTTFSMARSRQLQQQIESLAGAEQNLMWAWLDEQYNYLRVTLSENYDPAFLQSVESMVASNGLVDYVHIEEVSQNVNF